MNAKSLLAVSLLGSLTFAVACDSKVAECEKLASIVNDGVEAMSKIEGGKTDDPAKLAADAQSMADLAKKTKTDIDAIGIKTEDLKPKAAAYQEMMAQMGEVGGEIAEQLALIKELDTKLEAAAKEFEGSQPGLQKICEQRTPDCEKLSGLIDSQPSDPTDEEAVAVYEKYAKDLGGLAIEEDANKEIVAKHKGAVEAYVKAVAERSAVDKKLSGAEDQLSEVVAKEEKIVDDLNTYCIGTANPS